MSLEEAKRQAERLYGYCVNTPVSIKENHQDVGGYHIEIDYIGAVDLLDSPQAVDNFIDALDEENADI